MGKSVFGESNLQALYSLPVASNATERGRLDARHKGLILCLRGLYTPPDKVQQALQSRADGRQPAILDVGTGAGNWAEDMAREFPHAKVLGIDLNPVKISTEKPPNCKFEVRDASKSFGDLAEAFDVVHVRAVENGLRNQRQSLTHFAQLLPPGGVLLLGSVGMWLYGTDKELLPCVEESDPRWSALGCLYHYFQTLMINQGREVDAFRRWEGWLQTNPLYQDVTVTDVYSPVGPWKPDSDGIPWQEIGDCFGKNIMIALDYTADLLIQGNYAEAVIQRLLEKAKQELRDMNPKTYLMYRYVSATRSEMPWKAEDVPT